MDKVLMFHRVERRARRFREMMQRLDVDPAVLARLRGGDAYAEARKLCLFCGTSDTCLRWLEQPAQPGNRADFCPNRKLFEGCARKPPAP